MDESVTENGFLSHQVSENMKLSYSPVVLGCVSKGYEQEAGQIFFRLGWTSNSLMMDIHCPKHVKSFNDGPQMFLTSALKKVFYVFFNT
jgi:hypothetical protein